MCAKLLQSCSTLCDPMDHSPPGSSVLGILQARVLEWVAISFSRGSSWTRDQTRISYVFYFGKITAKTNIMILSCLPLRIFQFQAFCLSLIHIVILLSEYGKRLVWNFILLYVCGYPIFLYPFLVETILSSYSWHPCWRSVDWICVDLFLFSLFCPIDV